MNDGDCRTPLERALDLPSAREAAEGDDPPPPAPLDDDAFDELRQEGLHGWRTLVDTALAVEPKFAGPFLTAAIDALRIALDAVSRARRIDVDRRRLDGGSGESTTTPTVSREELLAELRRLRQTEDEDR